MDVGTLELVELSAELIDEPPCGCNHNWPGLPPCSVHVVVQFSFSCEPFRVLACQNATDWVMSDLRGADCPNCGKPYGVCWITRPV